jgi:hypothetical protein
VVAVRAPTLAGLLVLVFLAGCSGDPQSRPGNIEGDSVVQKNPYEGTFMGIFDYTVSSTQGGDDHGSLQLTVVIAATGLTGQDLSIESVTASDAYFGCQTACAPLPGSSVVLPDDPPTTPSNPSQPGHGFLIHFPNGRTLMTNSDTQGAVTVMTGAGIISNGLGVAAGDRWHAATRGKWWSDDWVDGTGAFHQEDCQGQCSGIAFDSWSLTKSAL